VICASNQDLEARVRENRFREDLYYRINVIPIQVPPLRNRADDVLVLARHFAREAGARNGRSIESVGLRAADALRAHTWPGNVRELRNVIERAVIMGRGPALEAEDLSIGTGVLSPRPESNGESQLVDRLMSSEIAFDEFEREVLVQALQRAHGNQSRAARLLGMTRRTLQYRIDKFKIDASQMK
ncbi:MAG: AAA-type ATPase lid domain-containing protein, partial [Planctomycetota bacterium]